MPTFINMVKYLNPYQTFYNKWQVGLERGGSLFSFSMNIIFVIKKVLLNFVIKM